MTKRIKDYEITNRIPVTKGMGIEWKRKGIKYMTASASYRAVSVHIDSWTTCDSLGAIHWYARFGIHDLESLILNGKDKGMLCNIFCREFPEEAGHLIVEVTKFMKEDEYGVAMSTQYGKLIARKGSRYTGFKDREEAVKYAKETYKRLFCDKGCCGWRLKSGVSGMDVDDDYNEKGI